MRQYTSREFIRIVKFNGFRYSRHSGDHAIYVNDKGRHISIPNHLECVIAGRLIKENCLEVDIKKLKRKMKESGYYPAGAEFDPNAPWNQSDPPEKEIDVLVSVTLSKTVKVKVSDYEVIDSGKDEDGNYFEDIDYSNCDLKKAVKEQITLPHEAYKTLMVNTDISKKAYEDLKGWNVDDYECIIE